VKYTNLICRISEIPHQWAFSELEVQSNRQSIQTLKDISTTTYMTPIYANGTVVNELCLRFRPDFREYPDMHQYPIKGIFDANVLGLYFTPTKT
jgi:hypothetical protein